MKSWHKVPSRRVEARPTWILFGRELADFFLTLLRLYLLFPFDLSSGCCSFVRSDVFTGPRQQFRIGFWEGLVQRISESGLLQTFLQGRHGHNLIEVGDLQGGRVETGHKILQRFPVPLHNGEESVGVPWSPYAGVEMHHEHLHQLFK